VVGNGSSRRDSERLVGEKCTDSDPKTVSWTKNLLVVHWPRTGTQEIAPVNSPGALRGRRFPNSGKWYWPEIPLLTTATCSGSISGVRRGGLRNWLSAIAAAPPSGCHAPLGPGMPTRMPDSGIHRGRRVTDRSGCWTDGDFATAMRSLRRVPLKLNARELKSTRASWGSPS
jgi:hypothetical protein